MKERACEGLIMSLAGLMNSNQVDPAVICESLKLICDFYSFDCGAVYEPDQTYHFHIAERYSASEVSLPECFDMEALKPEHHRCLSEKTVFHIDNRSQHIPCEELLLGLFSASGLAVTPVLDETFRAYGLIVFLNQEPAHTPASKPSRCSDTIRADMEVPASMLARYVAPRVYRNKLLLAHTSMENILDNTGIDIYVNDFYSHDILYVNKSMAAPYGGQAQFYGRKCWQVLFPGQDGPCGFCPLEKIVDEEGEPARIYTWDYQRPFDGSWFRVFSAAFRWVDGRLAHVVSSADITDTKEKEALIQYMANYDSLTKLPNRRMLVTECEKRIDRATENEKGYLLFFDIDGFKSINDNFGHDAGDEFLVELGEFFTSIPMLRDSIYRNGGDEFVAVIGGETITKDNIRSLASFIHARFKKPWDLKNGNVYCNTSIGIACFPEDGRTAEKLLQIADSAMYHVKKNGGGGMCFGYELR